VTIAVVTFGLFTLWLLLAVSYTVQLFGVLGQPAYALWPVSAVLIGMAAVSVGAAWYGWNWHRKLYPSRPHGEQARPADFGKL
jgi:membrane protein YdbS with pleckstrin-like domain